LVKKNGLLFFSKGKAGAATMVSPTRNRHCEVASLQQPHTDQGMKDKTTWLQFYTILFPYCSISIDFSKVWGQKYIFI